MTELLDTAHAGGSAVGGAALPPDLAAPTRPLRLLFVGTNRGGGGTESHFITMVRAMADAGHAVGAVVWPGEFIHEALVGDDRIRLFPACFRVRNDVRATRQVMAAARAFRPDWLVGTFKFEYWPLAVAARLLRVPIVLFSHLDQRMQPWTLRGLPRVVHRIVAPSEYLRERLVDRGMPAGRVVVLHNPVDTTHFRVDPAARCAVRRELGVDPDDVVLGFVGRIEPEKGVELLGEALRGAMAREPRLRVLWVGHGRSEGALREAIASNSCGRRHIWRPWTADVFPHYAAMDLLALPSPEKETFGRVLAEAQACGVAVLGSRSGGIPETMVDGVSGLLLPPGDVAAWEEAIVRLAGDHALRARMACAGRRHVETRFAAPAVAAEFGRLLEAGAPRS